MEAISTGFYTGWPNAAQESFVIAVSADTFGKIVASATD